MMEKDLKACEVEWIARGTRYLFSGMNSGGRAVLHYMKDGKLWTRTVKASTFFTKYRAV
jgi:hypothetical protein